MSWIGAATETAAAVTDERIKSLASLIGLALALITVFTLERARASKALRDLAGKSKLEVLHSSLYDIGLFVATALLVLATAPLALETIDVANDSTLWTAESSLRNGFLIVFALLVALLLWQLTIAWRTLRQMRGRPFQRRPRP